MIRSARLRGPAPPSVVDHRRDGRSPQAHVLCNDPWVGGWIHQNDTSLFAPFFWDGKLFAWSSAVAHQVDIGGVAPGSWTPRSQDVFWESLPTPPVKIVRNYELQHDVEDVWLRRSRTPQIVGLDLRARVGANTIAHNRLRALIERYGPDLVKAVMKRVMDDAERRLREKLVASAWATSNVVAECLSKMLDTSVETLRSVISVCCGTWDLGVLAGLDQRSNPFVTLLLEPMAAGFGAKPDHDGVDTGGLPIIPMGRAPDAEINEFMSPVLYLWRREETDSGGPGRFRGGLTGSICIVPHALGRRLPHARGQDRRQLDAASGPAGLHVELGAQPVRVRL